MWKIIYWKKTSSPFNFIKTVWNHSWFIFETYIGMEYFRERAYGRNTQMKDVYFFQLKTSNGERGTFWNNDDGMKRKRSMIQSVEFDETSFGMGRWFSNQTTSETLEREFLIFFLIVKKRNFFPYLLRFEVHRVNGWQDWLKIHSFEICGCWNHI